MSMKQLRRLVLPLLFALVCIPLASVQAYAAAFVQQSSASSLDDVSSCTPSLTGVASGSLLTVVVASRNGVPPSSVSDNVNGSWTQAAAVANDADVSIWYYANSASGNPTVTVTLTGTTNHLGCTMAEFSGIATSTPLDDTATTINFGVNSHPHGTIDTASTAGLIITVAQENSDLTETPGSGYTEMNNGDRWFAQYRVTSTGSLSTDGAFSTVTTGNSYAAMASFLNASAPSSGLLLRRRRN